MWIQTRQWVDGSWVSGSNGSQFWMGHVGHGLQYVDPWPITVSGKCRILWRSVVCFRWKKTLVSLAIQCFSHHYSTASSLKLYMLHQYYLTVIIDCWSNSGEVHLILSFGMWFCPCTYRFVCTTLDLIVRECLYSTLKLCMGHGSQTVGYGSQFRWATGSWVTFSALNYWHMIEHIFKKSKLLELVTSNLVRGFVLLVPIKQTNNFFRKSGRGLASRSVQWGTRRQRGCYFLANVVFGGCTGADRRTLGDEWRLTGVTVCVITKSEILISTQFNISPYYSFMVQNQITVSLYRPISYHCYLTVGFCIVTLSLWLEAVWSAILATAWLLVDWSTRLTDAGTDGRAIA